MPGAPRLVLLASGAGSTVQALLDAPAIRPHVLAVGTDRPGCGAVERAAGAGVETFAEPLAAYPSRPDWNRALERRLAGYRPDLVVLAGFMRVLDAGVVAGFRIVNTHPALLPAFPGAHAIRDALAAGVSATGVTVHWVDEGVDTGPVLAQAEVPVEPGDDEDTLRRRVQEAEKPLYVSTVSTLCRRLGQSRPLAEETR